MKPRNIKEAGHHWLEKKDSDGNSFGLVVLQWNPSSQKWTHSGEVGTGLFIDVTYWEYVAPCPFP